MNNSEQEALQITQWNTWIYSDNPQVAADYATALGMVVHSVIDAQTKAVESIRVEVSTKGIIATILLLLLGINLYSCFMNALRDRKFEIGVKRAIGATGRKIVGQFLIESVAVMLVSIVASVVLVVNGIILYKLYQQIVLSYQWTAYISMYSIAMYVVCAIVLTIVFSLHFAYRSTQIEVVTQLRSE